MSQELFFRGIIALGVSIVTANTLNFRYNVDMGLEKREENRQKYIPYVTSGVLLGILIARIGLELFIYGERAAVKVTISLGFQVFFSMSLYYLVLLLTISLFRKYICAGTCAALWVLPTFLGITFYEIMELQQPLWVIRLPGDFVRVVFYVWFAGFCVVFFRGMISHMKFRREIMKRAKKVEEKEILELWSKEMTEADMSYTNYPLLMSSDVKTPLSIGM